jgi:DNA-binding FadR family transcriptional regulator
MVIPIFVYYEIRPMTVTRHEEITDCLTEDILRGHYRVGERLPSERDLASRFDANRGAAREAVKKLEQMGLVDVQPGGARIRAVEESSLDVLGHLLGLEEYPDPELMGQVMEVMEALITVAVKRAINVASDDEINEARLMIAKVLDTELSIEEVIQARMDLHQHFLRVSGNLVLALIGRSLRVQVMNRKSKDHDFLKEIDTSGQRQCLRWLDQSLAERDEAGAVSALQKVAELNRRLLLPALEQVRNVASKRGTERASGGILR